jgi:hypothetical protein
VLWQQKVTFIFLVIYLALDAAKPDIHHRLPETRRSLGRAKYKQEGYTALRPNLDAFEVARLQNDLRTSKGRRREFRRPFRHRKSSECFPVSFLSMRIQQPGLRLRRFGQKRSVSRKIAFIGVWTFWREPQLRGSRTMIRERSGNVNIRNNRIIHRASTARAHGRRPAGISAL